MPVTITYYIIHSYEMARRGNSRDRKISSGCQRLGAGSKNEEWLLMCTVFPFWGVENVIKLDCGNGCTSL